MFAWRGIRLLFSLVIVIVLSLELFSSLSFSVAGRIDVFTQKDLFNGKGLNMPSDAFGLNQEVIVYALVLYRERPVENVLVNFAVNGPSNDISNITLQVSAKTNGSGIAQISFRIPNDQAIAFGTWKVLGTAELQGITLQDLLEFQVGWIVELLDVETLDENLTYCDTFGVNGYVGAKIAMKNIAMTPKNVTLFLNVFDEVMTPINFMQIENLVVPPNEKITYIFNRVYLPDSMFIGNASLRVYARTPIEEGEKPYCPDVFTNFSVIPSKPIYPQFHDVSAFIFLPENSIEVGEKLVAELYIQNEGTETESFEVNLSMNSLTIQNITVQQLLPCSQRKIIVEWNTSGLVEGNYLLVANITPLENEADLSDNLYEAKVELFKKPPQLLIHDIAVTEVTPSVTHVYQGEKLEIYVMVKNNGTETESFNVTLYYGANVIDVLQIERLNAGESRGLTFVWNTTDVAVGNYTIKAEASAVEGEVNLDNNVFVNGKVEIKAVPLELIHDIAVIKVEVSPRIVKKGDVVNIKVTVRNEGNFSESFGLTVFYDGTAIETRNISLLDAGKDKLLSFSWNTSDVNVGVYAIKAEVSPVANEKELDDNIFIDGKVEVIEGEEYPPPWPLWLLLFTIGLLALFGLIVLAIILYRRRQLRKFKRAFYSGWQAWFYNYNLLRKNEF